jgi:phosphoglycerate dehydrogenase-like enzyme
MVLPLGVAQGKTVGIVGAGRIGTAYARMMVEVRAVLCLAWRAVL